MTDVTQTNVWGCIWCGQRINSAEHLFPEWLQTVITKLPKPLISTINILETSADGGSRHAWDAGGVAPPMTVRVVCRKCNNNWMSDIEAAAKPVMTNLILGMPTSLKADDCRAIATWAFLKAMVACGLTPPVRRPEGDWLKEFKETRNLPSTWRVWLSRYDGSRVCYYKGYDVKDARLMEDDGQERQRERHGVIAAFVIGCLAIKVLGLRRLEGLDNAVRSDYFLRIFPIPDVEVFWPPAQTVTDESFWDYERLFYSGPPPTSI